MLMAVILESSFYHEDTASGKYHFSVLTLVYYHRGHTCPPVIWHKVWASLVPIPAILGPSPMHQQASCLRTPDHTAFLEIDPVC